MSQGEAGRFSRRDVPSRERQTIDAGDVGSLEQVAGRMEPAKAKAKSELQQVAERAQDRMMGRVRAESVSEQGEPLSELDVEIPDEKVRQAIDEIVNLNAASSDPARKRAALVIRESVDSYRGDDGTGA